MEIVYLGGFIQLLQDILGGIFDAVLAPVLRDVFSILVNIFGALLHQILSNLLLKLWVILLKLVGFLESIFNVFSGNSDVEVKVQDVSVRITLLEYFFRLGTVQKGFLIITAVSMVLAFLATIIGVARSMSDMVLENKNPLSTVLRQAFQAAVSFLVIPMTCLFVLQMSSRVVLVFNTTFNIENQTATISDILFITTAEPAARDSDTARNYYSGQGFEDGEQVKKDFDVDKISYVQAYISSALVAVILLCSIMQFIQRILVILILYLVSPFFVAMIPVDGGAKFREWRSMFAAYMFSAFGPILAMKIFLIIVPVITSGSVNFGVSAGNAAWMRLFFIIGGAYAVYKSRLMFVSLIHSSSESSMAESGAIGLMAGKKIGSLVGKAAGSLAKKGSGNKGQGQGGQSGVQAQSQAYRGGR